MTFRFFMNTRPRQVIPKIMIRNTTLHLLTTVLFSSTKGMHSLSISKKGIHLQFLLLRMLFSFLALCSETGPPSQNQIFSTGISATFTKPDFFNRNICSPYGWHLLMVHVWFASLCFFLMSIQFCSK
jgi:hypothetical protein